MRTYKHILLTFLLSLPFFMNAQETPAFHIEQNEKGCFVEIPKAFLDRDFLLGARVVAVSTPANKPKLYAGQRLYDPLWIRFKQDGERLLMLRPDCKNICSDTTQQSYPAYARNSITPIQESWRIEKESDSSITVNWEKFFGEPINGVDPFNSKTVSGRSLSQLTKIQPVHAGDTNLEVNVQYGFDGTGQPFLTIVRKSLLLLPQVPMEPRLNDFRVGYDNIPKRIFDSEKPSVVSESYITRFRIAPVRKDLPRYLKGEKVRPQQPIVFYIDDAFPALWKKAIRRGILDWNEAFEEIGFKDAMQVRTYSEAGKDFDPDDIRFNCFRYVVSDFSNAMGKHWIDPRSGEILQADVLFHSSVISLLQKWYFLQTAAYNPAARNKQLPEQVLEHLIRYAAAHEVGHCLGLEHNFRASYSYKTEDLRNPVFTERYGTTPSIMDYARFNYVAQPGDGVKNVFPPIIGIYDKYAIRIGYAYLPHEDRRTVTGWIDKGQENPMLRHGRMNPSPVPTDPSVQSSDIGNDPVASATYGINNLKQILEHIAVWNKDNASDNPFNGMPADYSDLQKAYFDHLEHVIPFIGGVISYERQGNASSRKSDFISRTDTEKAVRFLLDELIQGHKFLHTDSVCRYAGNQTGAIIKAQKQIIEKMFSRIVIEHICESEQYTGFGLNDYFEMASEALFGNQSPDLFDMNLQQNYINALHNLEKDGDSSIYNVLFSPVINTHLANLKEFLAGQ